MSPFAAGHDCQHQGSPHQHGTRDSYALDACRCPQCRQANAAAEQERRRKIAYGRWRPFVDAEPARQHLRALSERGIGLRRAAQLSGVPYTTLANLVYGARSAGAPPNQQLRQDTERRVLALSLRQAAPADGARIDATGTHRRIQALVAIGWTLTALADHLGRDVASVRGTLRRDRVNIATATAVADVYEQLWNTPPDESTATRRNAASNARAMARSNGWHTAMAWDDIDVDPEPDPTVLSQPTHGADESEDLDIDIVTDRVAAGQSGELKPGRVRDQVIQELTRRGFSLPEIADLLEVTIRTVSRRRRAGRAA